MKAKDLKYVEQLKLSDYSYSDIAKWVSECRLLFKKGELDPEVEFSLRQAEISLTGTNRKGRSGRSKDSFKKYVSLIKEMIAEHGQDLGFYKAIESKLINSWVNRVLKKKPPLSALEIEELGELGLDCSRCSYYPSIYERKLWDEHLEYMARMMAIHGHTKVGTHTSGSHRKWRQAVIFEHKQGFLPEHKLKELTRLDIDFFN